MSLAVAESIAPPLPEGYFGLEQIEEANREKAQLLLKEVLLDEHAVFHRLWYLDELVNLGFARDVIAEDARHMQGARSAATHGCYTTEFSDSSQQGVDQGMSYNNVAYNVARSEDIGTAAYFDSEWLNTDDGNQWETGTDRIPLDALWLLDNLANPDIAARHQELSALLAPLRQKVLELSGFDPEVIGEHDMLRHFMGNRAGLRLREMGDYQKSFDTILKSRDRSVPEYLGTFGALYDTSLRYSFPEEFKDGIELGRKKLIADAAYAVAYHLEHNLDTDIELPLNGQEECGLSLKLEGKEPLYLLDSLLRTLELIRGPMGGTSVKEVVPAVISEDFNIYRFVRTNRQGGDPRIPPVLLHVRASGAVSYDPHYEYGRNGEGVEATFGYVVDPYLEDGKLIKIGKNQDGSTDNRISIRLDREGWAPSERHKEKAARDPTQTEGTVSLDVGSVLGRDDWLGVKLGRFLAWGNVLRTAAEGKDAQLNHVTEYFDSSLGDADTFADSVERFYTRIEQRTADSTRLASLFGGRIATKGSVQ